MSNPLGHAGTPLPLTTLPLPLYHPLPLVLLSLFSTPITLDSFWESKSLGKHVSQVKGCRKATRIAVSIWVFEREAPSRRLDCALSGPRPAAELAKDLEK